MLRYHDYDVRVWEDGDVLIDGRDLCYVQDEGGYLSIQHPRCDAEHLNRALEGACADVANAMRALDGVLDEIERRQDA